MANRRPYFNMGVAEMAMYREEYEVIRAIRLDNGLRGFVAHNDYLLREQLSVLQLILHLGSQLYSDEVQDILNDCIWLYRRLRNRRF